MKKEKRRNDEAITVHDLPAKNWTKSFSFPVNYKELKELDGFLAGYVLHERNMKHPGESSSEDT